MIWTGNGWNKMFLTHATFNRGKGGKKQLGRKHEGSTRSVTLVGKGGVAPKITLLGY